MTERVGSNRADVRELLEPGGDRPGGQLADKPQQNDGAVGWAPPSHDDAHPAALGLMPTYVRANREGALETDGHGRHAETETMGSAIHMQYADGGWRTADWRHRGLYIAKHGMTPSLADEALADPDRLVLDPDPASESGRTVRVVGWAPSLQALVSVIVLPDVEQLWGVNAWLSNSTDQRRYRQEQGQ